jgi:hypothetical protein
MCNPCLKWYKSIQGNKRDITLYYYYIKVQLFGTSRVQVQQD